MKILSVETSSLVASAAIFVDDIMIAEYTTNYKITHSQTLLPMIDDICRMTEFDINELDFIAVSGGPGSFTGLRIGSATAKGLGLALDIPLVHVPTLKAMAYNIYDSNKLICPIMDARREQVYTGIYRSTNGVVEALKDQMAITIHELIDILNEMDEDVIFLGDGVPVYKSKIEESLNKKAFYAPPHLSRQRGGAVCELGKELFAQGKYESSDQHAPEYLRQSQAERELAEKRGEANVL